MDELPKQIFDHLDRRLSYIEKKSLSSGVIRSICIHVAEFIRDNEKRGFIERIDEAQCEMDVKEFTQSLKEF